MLLDLPEELVSLCLTFLNVKELNLLSHTCSHLQFITNDSNLWRDLFKTPHGTRLITMIPPNSKYIYKINNNSSNNNNNVNTMNDNNVNQEEDDDISYWKYLALRSQWFDSVTEALNVAEPGSQIHLRPAIYMETLNISKPVSIIGIGDKNKIVFENKPDIGSISINITSESPSTETEGEKKSETAKSSLPTSLRGFSVLQKQTAMFITGINILSGNVTIEDCVIEANSYSCIYVKNGTALIQRNVLRGTSVIGVHVSSSTIVLDNQITAEKIGVQIKNCSDSTIRGNIIAGPATGIYVYNSLLTVIDNNNIHNSLDGVIVGTGSSAKVSNNKIHNNKDCGICLYELSIAHVDGNQLYENKQNLIVDSHCNPIVTNNKMRGGLVAIFVEENGGGTFEQNEISETTMAGILVKQGSNTRFIRNTIRDNLGQGFVVCGTCHLEGNTISRNVGGIGVRRTGKSTELNNTMEANDIQSKEITECIQRGECTFSVTGSEFAPQYWMFCDTCDDGETGCCAACAEVCHKGHKLYPRIFSAFYCDCGAKWCCSIMPKKS